MFSQSFDQLKGLIFDNIFNGLMDFGIIHGLCQIIVQTRSLQIKLQVQIDIKALAQLALLFKHSVISVILHPVQLHSIHSRLPAFF
ncbi:hypothetical protein D3C81_2141360 [compost metagenome]